MIASSHALEPRTSRSDVQNGFPTCDAPPILPSKPLLPRTTPCEILSRDDRWALTKRCAIIGRDSRPPATPRTYSVSPSSECHDRVATMRNENDGWAFAVYLRARLQVDCTETEAMSMGAWQRATSHFRFATAIPLAVLPAASPGCGFVAPRATRSRYFAMAVTPTKSRNCRTAYRIVKECCAENRRSTTKVGDPRTCKF